MFAKGAKMGGVQIFEDTKVTGITTFCNRVTGVQTDQGNIQAEYVVNAAGMWARQLGAMVNVDLPLHAAEHYYLITEPIDGIHNDLPVIEKLGLYQGKEYSINYITGSWSLPGNLCFVSVT